MTQHLYVIGHPVAHSKSPAMYNALYGALGLDWEYGCKDFEYAHDADAFLADRDWLSVNITTPYKPNAFAAADVKAASARLTRGVNMLINRNGKLVGMNTDGIGCIRHIEREGYSFGGAAVVVCGTGPTSLAMVQAAAQAGASRVTLVGRVKQRSERALARFVREYGRLAYATMDLSPADGGHRSFREGYDETDFLFGSYRTSTQAIADADIIIDATPLGMKKDDPAPFPARLLHGQQLVYDVVYAHGETALVRAARDAGVDALDGRGMLAAQAVENALALLQMEGVDNLPSWDDMFRIMAQAAGFPC